MKRSSSKSPGFIKTARKLVTGKNRNAVLAGSLGAVLLATGVLALVFRSETAPVDLAAVSETEDPREVTEIDTAEPMSATITIAEGIVEYKTGDAWMPVDQDMEITSGTSIRTTGAASRAAVELADETAIRIDASTEIMFESLTEARVVVIQQSGHVYNRVTASGTRSYVVQTENAQFQSVGTAFRTSASGDEEAVEVFHSSVREVTSSLQAQQGEKIVMTSFSNPDRNETIEKLNLQSIKEDRFITWNRDQDKANDTHKNLLGFLSDYDGPDVNVVEPAAGSSVTVGENDTQGTVQIKGNTEAGASLTARSKSIAGSNPINVQVGDDGSFTTPALKGPLGTSVFEFIAIDRSGNKTWETVSYTFSKKATTQEQGIVLTVDQSDPEKLTFEWGLVGMTTPDGIYLVSSKDDDPTYPNDAVEQVRNGSTTTIDAVSGSAGITYKVCRYDADNDSCDVYSNGIVSEQP